MYEDATVIDLIKIDIEINTSKRTTAAATTTIIYRQSITICGLNRFLQRRSAPDSILGGRWWLKHGTVTPHTRCYRFPHSTIS